MRQRVAAAQSSGNVAEILRLLTQTARLTPQDFVKKTVGLLLYLYYLYLDRFHLKPKDIEDLVDGLLYIETQSYIQEQSIKDEEAHKTP